MSFEIIPAIDVAGGRLVRMSRDGVTPVDAEGGDPVAIATRFAQAGAARLHVVDVDLATTGTPSNLDVVRAIAALGVPVQASGGVTSRQHVEALLDVGSERIVLSSGALASRSTTEELIEAFADRLCIGIEADGATIRPRAAAGLELALWEVLEWLAELDVRRYVFTDVRRGSPDGPDLDGIWALAVHTGRPVVASGGVRSIEDLKAIASLGGSVEGAVVGRALHEGLDLADAMRAIARSD